MEIVKISSPFDFLSRKGWVHANFFNGWFNSGLTLLTLGLLGSIVPALVKWVFLNGVWFTSSGACQQAAGACWSIVTQNFRFIIFGFYPYDQQWQPLAAMLILFSLLICSHDRRRWSKRLGYAWIIGLMAMTVLMRGGVLGLPPVENEKWGGLPLTLLLAIFALTAAYPLGVMLALGRPSRMPVNKILSVVYIEMIRGVPLISLLFMGSIILPQALKIVIPPTVSILISAFKDTSLVVIIASFDLLKTTQTVISNPEWMGYSHEAFVFIALLYFLGCFSMANFSRKLERQLSTGR